MAESFQQTSCKFLVKQWYQRRVRGDASITRKYGGTGLGLTICTRLVDLMQGQLYVESELDQGSTFHFTACFSLTQVGKNVPALLPVAPGTKISAAHFLPPLETVSMPPASLINLSVLIVDDNASSLKALSNMLTSLKMQVSTAESGETAIAMLRSAVEDGKPYQLVLLDQRMPVLDGYAVAEVIKQDPRLSQVTRVLMMTPTGRSEDFQFGISAYLTKPVSYTDFLNTFKEPKKIETKQLSVPQKAARSAHILLAEDNPVNQKLATRLLERLGHKVTLAQNGLQAVSAYNANTFDLVLMDELMPEMGGLEATKIIRQSEQELGRRTPIIGMIANSLQHTIEIGREAGMDDHLSKPLRAEQLKRLIEMYLEKQNSNPEEILIDQSLLREIAPVFLAQYPAFLNQAEAAITSLDHDLLYRAAHALKGAIANFSMDAAKPALDLELIAKQ
eukprot:TRINITY_DN2857_c0_g1_i5.p1 TRINITY_DN2857_c0_g1~~TRINITY_DN2857_c0_g1_i5.p1  ORF type:complete len:448 (-),score=111.50 TRINITY_DN2857_c0_g1_i5:142-1485(-)